MAKAAHIVGKLSEVAAFYGVGEASVRTNWRPNMPDVCGKPGYWNLLEIGRWLVTDYYQQRSAPEGTVKESIAKARLAKLVEEALTARLKRERMDGTLIKRTTHSETLMMLSGLYASAIDEAESIADTSAPKSRKVKIKGQFERIRGRLRKRLEKMS